jgi:non-specific serine/threonine protein kinase
MIAGEAPFTANTPRAVMTRHMVHPPSSLRSLRPSVPEQLDRCVQRALGKDRRERQAGLAAFAAELAEIETGMRDSAGGLSGRMPPSTLPAVQIGARETPGIIVLPFKFLSAGASGNDFLAAALSDEIITRLSRLQGLRVISQTSAIRLQDTSKSARELGAALNVAYVLEGLVRQAGQAVRVAVRMVSTETEALVWGQSYEGSIDDSFALEQTIAEAVAETLALRLTADEKRSLRLNRAADARAIEYFLRAKQEIYKFTEAALERALDYLRRGAAICGDSVAIWAAMGYVYWQYVNAGISSDPAYFERARECADRILAIDADSPEARRLLGLIEISARGNPQVAVDHLRAALEANPNDPDALFWLAIIYGFAGRPSSGYALAIRLLDIDPLTPLHHLVPGFLDVLDGDAERGLPWLAKARDLEPANPIAGVAYGQALAMAGQRHEACRILEDVATRVPGSFFAGMSIVLSRALDGCHEESLAALSNDVLDNAQRDLQYSWTLGQCYALLGRLDDACGWVENAVRHGFWNYPLLALRDPLLQSLREHPRYRILMNETKTLWLGFRA